MSTSVRPGYEATRACEFELLTAVHDLRNRLSIAGNEIQQLSRLLVARLGTEGAGVAQDLEAVERCITHSSTVLEELLELANRQLEDGVHSEASLVDLVRVTTKVVATKRRATRKHRLVLMAGAGPLVGCWEEARLAHLVDVLISNALLYTPAGGNAVVTLERQPETVILQVADDGIGIPAEDLPRIFEPFFRARNAERVAPGLGLGLSTAWHIVERYSGSIDVVSAEGVGTTCTVRLPLESGVCVSRSMRHSSIARQATPRFAPDSEGQGGRARARRAHGQ